MQTTIPRPSTREPAEPAPPIAVPRTGLPRPRWPRGDALLHIPLIVGAGLMLFPFYWMLTTSVKGIEEASAFPPTLWPTQWLWDNYPRAWQAAPFARYFVNTVIVALGQVLGVLITS